VLVELVEDDLWHRLALQLDDDAHAAAVGEVADLCDLADGSRLHEVGDLRDDTLVAALLHGVRQLGDDDRRAPAAKLLGMGASTHHHAAAA
jgi:hypothetical protein